jgi:hypothetical protein
MKHLFTVRFGCPPLGSSDFSLSLCKSWLKKLLSISNCPLHEYRTCDTYQTFQLLTKNQFMKHRYFPIKPIRHFRFVATQWLLLFALLIVTANASAADITLQAESGTLTGVSTANSIAGYTGSGYINGATFDAAGDRIAVTANIPTAGSYQLKIRYNGAYGTKRQDVYINGVLIGNIEFLSSGGWVEGDLGLRSFVAGNNTIEIRYSWGWMHVDKFTIVGVPTSSSAVPGTIQAENFSAMSGIQTETTTDAGGGLNVGSIDANDWMDYNVTVATAGSYTVSFRVASTTSGKNLQLRQGSTTLSTVTIPNTGGWQSWTTVTATVTLAAGAQTLRLTTTTGGFNINWVQYELPAPVTDRITVSGSQFRVGSKRIWLNGANTPWDNWNDFGGNFDAAWWDLHFQELKNNGINSTRIWITCSPENQAIIINDAGFVSGVSSLFWSHVDQLMNIARNRKVYVMMALISFDHTKNTYQNYQRYRNMMSSQTNVNSFADNFVRPLVQRYNSNPYLFSIDVCNEIIWMHEDANNAQFAWPTIQYYIARVAAAIHQNSNILVTVGDYINYTSPNYEGNKYSNAALQAQYNNPAAYLDFYKLHYYPWVGRWFGVHPQLTPTQISLTDKPIVIGEISANGVYTQNTSGQDSWVMSTTQGYETAYQNGWQGVMAWTSNGVDGNGGMAQLSPATNAFRNNHFSLVFPNETQGARLAQEDGAISEALADGNANFLVYPNPATDVLIIKQPGKFDIEILNIKGEQVFKQFAAANSLSVNVKDYPTGTYVVRINDRKRMLVKKFMKK